MRHTFHTDNAAPCWHCRGTVATYRTDTAVSLVDVFCIGCGQHDIFQARAAGETAAEVSAAHRASRTAQGVAS